MLSDSTSPGGSEGIPLSIGFPPVVDVHCRVLVLGSLPGRRSLEARQYYALPRNAFWPIMGELFGAGPALSYERRLNRLVDHRVALWDVLEASVRKGSLDSNIIESTARCNDFVTFFSRYPAIELVCFNGQKAAQIFRRRVLPELRSDGVAGDDRRYLTLPSTSPAFAGMPFEEKLSRWSVVKLR